MIAEIVPEEMIEMDYLEYKTEVLYQLGLSDMEGVREYLKGKCANAPTELKKRIQIDNAARKIMMDYYDGDRTYCKTRKAKTGSYYHRIIKRAYPKMETLYEDIIISAVGKEGFDTMRREHLIETCGMFDGRKLYAI